MIRLYRKEDYLPCWAMLHAEGLGTSDMEFEKWPTTVFEDRGKPIGFFTLYEKHGEKAVCHFVVHKEHREMRNIVPLLKAMKDEVRRSGKRLIIHEDKPHIDRLIQWYFKCQPYARNDRFRFYCVEV